MNKICFQLPVTMPEGELKGGPYYTQLQKHFAKVKKPGTNVLIKGVAGPRWESSWEKYTGLRSFNYVRILKSVLEAEKEGCDGVSISCFFDPALGEARQLLKIPVTGLAEASMHFACLMGSRFAIITKDIEYIPPMESQIYSYGMENKAIKLNPVRALTIAREKLSAIEQGIFTGVTRDYSPVIDNFKKIAQGCIHDGAEVLIMGCGLLSPLLMEAGLLEVDGVALVEPNHASLKLVEALVDLHKAGIPFISRKSTYLDVPDRYIAGVIKAGF